MFKQGKREHKILIAEDGRVEGSPAYFEAGELVKSGTWTTAAAPERLKKYCSHPAEWKTAAVFLGFGFVSAQSQGCFEPAPSPKPRQNPKILAPNGHNISLNAPARIFHSD
jgi:hypothetical protein